jgi:hypothetical protein
MFCYDMFCRSTYFHLQLSSYSIWCYDLCLRVAHSLLALKAYYFPRVSWCSFFVRISNNIIIIFLEHNANIRDGADNEKGNFFNRNFVFLILRMCYFPYPEKVLFT